MEVEIRWNALKKAGITMEAIADYMGLQVTSLSMMRNGKRPWPKGLKESVENAVWELRMKKIQELSSDDLGGKNATLQR